MTKYNNTHINALLSLVSYLLVFVVYPIELSLFGDKISHLTSPAVYTANTAYLMVLPLLLIILGIYFSYRSRKSNESVWAGVLLGVGILFLLAVLFFFAAGSEINGSEALLSAAFAVA